MEYSHRWGYTEFKAGVRWILGGNFYFCDDCIREKQYTKRNCHGRFVKKMNPPHFVGRIPVHQCPESYLTGRTRWLIFLFRQCHVVKSTGLGGAIIERITWPHAHFITDEYMVVVQGFEVVKMELGQMISEEEQKRKDNAPQPGTPPPRPPLGSRKSPWARK